MSTGGSRLRPLIAVVGPTGCGKSQLALELAHAFNGSIINSDAMQMYRGLDIVTNKPTPRPTCPHYMIDLLDPLTENYSVRNFSHVALGIIGGLHSLGSSVPIIEGGTNYYLESLLFESLLEIKVPLLEAGNNVEVGHHNEENHKLLMEIDSSFAEKFHPNDSRKIKKAIEIYKRSGRTMSELYSQQRMGAKLKLRFKNICLLYIHRELKEIDDLIERRVDGMIEKGLVGELREFHRCYPSPSPSRKESHWSGTRHA